MLLKTKLRAWWNQFLDFFFRRRIYGVNFQRINNGRHATTIMTIAAREIKKKNWCVMFLWSSLTYLNKKKKKKKKKHKQTNNH